MNQKTVLEIRLKTILPQTRPNQRHRIRSQRRNGEKFLRKDSAPDLADGENHLAPDAIGIPSAEEELEARREINHNLPANATRRGDANTRWRLV